MAGDRTDEHLDEIALDVAGRRIVQGESHAL